MRTAGDWHQDYGYWYYNGCQIALDRSGVENGCLEMVRGSHLLGRIDHAPVPGGRGVFPWEYAAPIGAEPVPIPAVDADLLL